MHPKNISITDYAYHLPAEKIASYPLSQRDASRLLIYQAGKIAEDQYKNLAAHIPEHSLLIFNNSKVIEARLLFEKISGGIIEIFCLAPDDQYVDTSSAMTQTGKVYWECLIGGASKWKPGQILEKQIPGQDHLILSAAIVEKRPGSFIIEFSWTPGHFSFAEILHQAGMIPLPPYIKRKAETSDSERYQTIYAQSQGSVAAPTAGLHFTAAIFAELEQKKIWKDFITLHVGAGTFKPVKAASMGAHEMHAEFIDVSSTAITHILESFRFPIIAVGTTSFRTIESLYWLGLKTLADPSVTTLSLSQWEVYEWPDNNISVEEALQSLLGWMKKNAMTRLLTRTQILVAPGYQAKIITGLVTNFHQPASTLLLLVAAFVGEDWKNIYQYALAHDFRFLSYGDGCLLWRT